MHDIPPHISRSIPKWSPTYSSAPLKSRKCRVLDDDVQSRRGLSSPLRPFSSSAYIISSISECCVYARRYIASEYSGEGVDVAVVGKKMGPAQRERTRWAGPRPQRRGGGEGGSRGVEGVERESTRALRAHKAACGINWFVCRGDERGR